MPLIPDRSLTGVRGTTGTKGPAGPLLVLAARPLRPSACTTEPFASISRTQRGQ